jgi:FkbM family methyltransferase
MEAAEAVGPNGRVIAIEPMPRHAQQIRDHAELNGFGQIDVIQTAVGDRRGEASIGLPEQGANEGMYCIGGREGAICVPVRTIDEIVQTLGVSRLDLIKMDIEGAEFAALTGARDTLTRFRPVILIEINSSALSAMGSCAQEVTKLLGNLRYEGRRIDRNGLKPSSGPAECDEYIFVPCP